MPVVGSRPAMFSANSTGRGQGAKAVYPNPVLPVTVTLGGRQAKRG